MLSVSLCAPVYPVCVPAPPVVFLPYVRAAVTLDFLFVMKSTSLYINNKQPYGDTAAYRMCSGSQQGRTGVDGDGGGGSI